MIIKPKKNRMDWKPSKTATGPAPGLYQIDKDKVLPKSPRTMIGKDKLRSVLDKMSRQNRKVPGVGQYNIHP